MRWFGGITPETRWGERRWWYVQEFHLGFDLPCCPKHQQKPLVARMSKKVQQGPAFFGIPTSSTIIQIQPRCSACTQLLKSQLAEKQPEAIIAE